MRQPPKHPLVAALIALAFTPLTGSVSMVYGQELPPIEMGLKQSIDFDDPTSTSYGEWYFPIICPDPFDPGHGFIRPECFGDPTGEDAERESVRGFDRIVRAGVLFIGALAANIEYLKEIVQAGQDMYNSFQAIVHAFDWKRPEQTILRLAMASDRLEYSLDLAEEISRHHQLPTRDQRYNKLQMLAIRGIALATDAHESAVTLSDQNAGMKMRIADDGYVEISNILRDKRSQPVDGLPPLPRDANSMARDTYRSGAPKPQMIAGDPRSTALFGPRLVAGPAQTAGGDDASSCPLPDDSDQDPAVMFHRVAVMAKGAQTAAIPVITDLRENRNLLMGLRHREKLYDRQTEQKSLFSSFFVH